jgi:release factor glutamine methyltransferase
MYNPSDDSFFFADFLEKYLSGLSKDKKEKITLLDMGSGSGILAETAKKAGVKNIIAAEINKKAVQHIKNKNIPVIQSDLFKPIKTIKCGQDRRQLITKANRIKLLNQKFDIILFNAPYLPQDKEEPIESQLETTGGKMGDEISIEFLAQAKKHLKANGKIFLLISSLTPLNRIKMFKPHVVARKKIWFEELLILRFSH